MSRKGPTPRRAPTPTPVCIFGAGRLARALLPLLKAAGYPPAAVVARRLPSARSATRLSPGARATTVGRRPNRVVKASATASDWSLDSLNVTSNQICRYSAP